ncbi:MAG TPA: putative Ig domain-containing protein [Acidobacteriota bacterium]|nr:putative Ig domain-containing protein [Acidobacteriota bacterium]HQO18868.1 putative Ig domain-containing protein [Acidobacteriota bacterium]HQQ47190.1 putative Ig domain-containing protein [Acidobacteriota bacterium]
MKRIVLGFILMVLLITQVASLRAETPVEQVWPTGSEPATYDYYYQSQPWVAVNPFDQDTIYVYAEGKILKSVTGGQSWNEIGNGLPNRAVFTDTQIYPCPLAFSPFDETGDTFILGTERLGVCGVPYMTEDGGETFFPINICEKGPGHSNLNFRFGSSTSGVFSKKDSNYIFLSGVGEVGGQPVFIGDYDEQANSMSILQNSMFPTTTGSCPSTSLSTTCLNSNSPGCWQYGDTPCNWGGELRLTVFPNSNDYFETEVVHTDSYYSAGYRRTQYKIYDSTETGERHCLLDNVFFDMDYYGSPYPDSERYWHINAPVFYSGENSTFFTVIPQVLKYSACPVGDPPVGDMERIYFDDEYETHPLLARCDGLNGNGDWIFTVVDNGELPQSCSGNARWIKKDGNYLFISTGKQDDLLAYDLISEAWITFSNMKVDHFELVDLENNQIGILYMKRYAGSGGIFHTELRLLTFNPSTCQYSDTLKKDFTGTFTGLFEYHLFAGNSTPWRDTSNRKNLFIFDDNIAAYFSGKEFKILTRQHNEWSTLSTSYLEDFYYSSSCDLCTANFTSMAVKDVGESPKWGYLSSDAGIWRNMEIGTEDDDGTVIVPAFKHISGGYGCTEPCTGEIPATDFGNYCYKVIIDPRITNQTILYAACRSGLWKGIESQATGNPVAWTQVFPQILEGPDAGVKDVLIAGGNVFIITAAGVMRSQDDADWTLVYDTSSPALAGGPVTAITAFPNTVAPYKIAWAVGSSLYNPTVCGALYLYTFGEGGDTLEVLVDEDDLAAHDVPLQKLQCVNEDGCDYVYFLNNAGFLNKVSIKLDCPTMAISPSDLPAGLAGVAYSQTLEATGGSGPYSFKLTNGTTLPPGLTLATTGVLSGTPTAKGLYTFVVKATDAYCCLGMREYSIQIDCHEVTMDPPDLHDGYLNIPYSQSITAAGGTAPYTFSSYDLPSWLTLSSGGLLTAESPLEGTCSFTITATDANGCKGVHEYSLNILPCPTITIDPKTLPRAIILDSYDQPLSIAGGTPPYTLSVTDGGLPRGIWVWPKDDGWHLSGDASHYEDAGNYRFTITATDAYGCAGSQQYSLEVAQVTISSKTVELACENGVAHLVLKIEGSNLSAKCLSFFSYVDQRDETPHKYYPEYEAMSPISVTDTEILLSIPAEWTFLRAIDVQTSALIIDTIVLSPPFFTPFYAYPEGGDMSGGNPVTIHGMNFTAGTTVSFYINGNWVDQDAEHVSPDTMTIAATTPGPTCEGPVDMKVVFPSGCELVVPSAYIYGFQGTLYTDNLSGAVAGYRQSRFFVCPDCPERTSGGCQASFSDGSSAAISNLGYTLYADCGPSATISGNLYEIGYISPTEMTAKLPVIPSGCATFTASNLLDCSDTIFTPPTQAPCDYRYYTYNEGLATGGTNSNASGFMTPIDTDNNVKLSWASSPGGSELSFDKYLSSVSVFPYLGWDVTTFRNLAVATPYPSNPNDILPLVYIVDVSSHKIVDIDNNPANGITGIPMPEYYGIKYPLKSQVYIPSGSWSMYGLVAGTGPSPLAMSPTGKPILNIVDLDSKSPTRYRVINKYLGGDSIATDLALAVIPVENNTDKTYAFISEFIFHHEGPNPPPPIECPPCLPLPDHGRPIPTPSGYSPGLLILDVSYPRNIHKVAEYMIEGNAGDGFENFALTLAKNSNDTYIDAEGNISAMPYVYLVAPGADKVMVYDVVNMEFVTKMVGEDEVLVTYDVGETPTDLAWAHYPNPADPTKYLDKVYVTCLNPLHYPDEGDPYQSEPCDPIWGLNVQDFGDGAIAYPTEEGFPECDPGDIPLPTAIAFRADGQYGYVVQGYGGAAPNGRIFVFNPATPQTILQEPYITLDPGTNPTRFDAGAYVDINGILHDIKYTIIEAPDTYFDVPAHKQALFNQTKAIDSLLASSAKAKAIISKLDAMESDVKKWVVHQDTKNALVLQIDTEKIFVSTERK